MYRFPVHPLSHKNIEASQQQLMISSRHTDPPSPIPIDLNTQLFIGSFNNGLVLLQKKTSNLHPLI